jgi:hypothetical protein
MFSVRPCKTLIPVMLLACALTACPAFATRTHRAATSGHAKTGKKKSPATHQLKGQRQIDPERAREIQTALIREHYLTGEPSGQWDAQSQAAMTRFQADQGWQTKLTPDSRALIKLGLGPNNATSNDAPKAIAGTQASLPASSTQPGADALLGSSQTVSQ